MDIKEFGKQVQLKRKERGFSQTELADMIDISRNYVSIIERGEAEGISMRVINHLATTLGVSPSELIGESTLVMIPPSLREFGLKNNLSYEIIDKLARIPRRGKEPNTVSEWTKLYEAISQFIEKGND